MGEIFCVTGLSAAGKSVLSRHLAEEFGMSVFNLGDYQREKFKAYGTPQQYHKKLGLGTTYYALWPEFIDRIASSRSNGGIIVDSVYTYEFLTLLRKTFENDNIHLMQVAATRHVRLRFFQFKTKLRGADAFKEMHKLDSVKRDVGLVCMLRIADFTVRNNTGLNEFLRNSSRQVREYFR